MPEKTTNEQAPEKSVKPQPTALQQWFEGLLDYAKHMCQTAFALLYIVNGVAIGLFAFGFVHPPRFLAAVFGAISIAFATVSLGTLVNYGVKYQATIKRKR